MRVAIDINSLLKERSGVGQYVYHLVDGLGTVDCHNEYVLFYNSIGRPASHIPRICDGNVSIKRIPCHGSVFKLASGLGKWKLPGFEWLFGSFDVYHWPNYLLVPGSTGKHIITIHDLTFLVLPSYHPAIRLKVLGTGISLSASRADAIIAVSEHTKRDVVKYLGISENKIRVIHSAASSRFVPISPGELPPVLGKYHLSPGGYLLYVGNIEPRKNLTRLLQSYSILRRQGGDYHPLILCGGKGWKNSEIYQKVEALSLTKDVEFLGYIPDQDMPYLMNGASLLVYPSLYEGFGLPPLEAMACGTPVVSSNASSLLEVVGDAAKVVDPYDVDGLAEAMHRVLTSKATREEMRWKGLRRAKCFSWEKTARETLKVYQEVYAGDV